MDKLLALLRDRGVQPTPQRLDVARFVLEAEDHPTAEQILAAVRRRCPTLSRATVYNTLNLLVAKGLLAARTMKEGAVVYDPRLERHHHFIDEETGEIHDIPWSAVKVTGAGALKGFEVRDYQVVMHGRTRASRRPK